MIWAKVGLDVIYIPNCRGRKYLIMARDNFLGWPKGRPLRKAIAKEIAKFI